MSGPAPSAVAFTPSDTVLLACERFAPVPGPWARFKRKSVSLLTIVGPLLAAALGAAAAIFAGGWVAAVALAGVVWLFRKLSGWTFKELWRRIEASEERRDGTVNPLQRSRAVLEEPLAAALVSSALLANESAGVVQLVVAGGVLQAVPTGAGKPWPAASLEDRLRRNKQLPVATLVEDWLESSSQLPYRRAVTQAEQGMVTRGLAVMSEAGDNPGAVLIDTTESAAAAVDGGAASILLEACRRERPQVWRALQTALAEAFKKRRTPRELGYSFGVNYSIEMTPSRDAPLGAVIVSEKTSYASEKDPAPVELLEARPIAAGAASDRPGGFSSQREIASKLPGWVLWLIDRFKGLLSPSSAEVEAAIKSRLQAQKPAAAERYETVDTSPSIPVGQRLSIPTQLVEATELPPPTAAHRELLDRSGRDWARAAPTDPNQGKPLDVNVQGSAGQAAIANLLLFFVPALWRRWRRRRARARLLKRVPAPLRLLMLRVFGSPSYDDLIALIQPWRRVGVIQHLDGFDTIGTRPEAIAAVKAGRLEDILVETREEVERELSALSLKPDNDLLFGRHAFQCTDRTWQLAVRGMMDRADAVVMDLSSLSPTNQGCAWEIGQLLDRVPLSRVTLLVNDSTDLECLQAILDAAARRVAANSPNRDDPAAVWRLVRIGGLAARQPSESYFDWKRRTDTRLEPEVLAGFLMTTAEPRRNAPGHAA